MAAAIFSPSEDVCTVAPIDDQAYRKMSIGMSNIFDKALVLRFPAAPIFMSRMKAHEPGHRVVTILHHAMENQEATTAPSTMLNAFRNFCPPSAHQ